MMGRPRSKRGAAAQRWRDLQSNIEVKRRGVESLSISALARSSQINTGVETASRAFDQRVAGGT